MNGIRSFADNIKIRGSWGILGNQYVGASNYPYLAYLTDVAVPTIGTIPNLGYTQAILPNDRLTWETIHMTNVGLDASFLQNKLSLTADWFVKDTRDILLVLTYPNVLGMTPTDENAGSVRNQGWEVEVKWEDNIGKDFSYGASFSLSDVKNEVTDLAGLEPTVGSYSIRKVGESIGAFYGLEADGIAMPWDFQRYDPQTRRYIGPKFPILSSDAGLVQPGDIKYKDLGGPNGAPDGKITLDNDRKVIGSPIPRYNYDFKGNIAWKGIDFNIMIQGVGKADGYLTGAGRHAFIDQSAYPQKVHKDRWTPTNPDPDAAYPRFTANYNYNQRFSTYWLENASYLRVKNIQLGYTFKKSFTQKMKIDKCRVYLSADNLFTLTDFFYAYDPESPVSSGGFYPQVKTVIMGFNVTFK
jgi:TonB-linked SusC/RagA family outer membrane protein